MSALATVAPADAGPNDTGLARFAGFVAAFSSLVAEQPAEPGLLARGGQLLAALLRHDDWLPDAYAAPDPVRYRQYLLHRDPADLFSVVSFVWGPGQATPVHDHRTWGLVGVLRGAELAEAFTFDAEGALRSTGPARRIEAGAIDSVSPAIGDVHRVANAYDDRVSISIHVYGGDIGAIERATYDRNGQPKRFVSGYADLPALIDQPIPPRNGEGDHAKHGGGAGATAEASSPAPAPPPSSTVPLPVPGRIKGPNGTITPADIRATLIARHEIALIDLRDEAAFATGHPLFAAQLPPERIELEAGRRLPRRDVPIILYDAGEGLVDEAADRFRALGYSDVRTLAGGLAGWRDAGYELFEDVNSYAKAFGELVEHRRGTPSLAAPEVQALIDAEADIAILDARRFDEFATMSLPGGISVPGAELVLRAPSIAPDPATTIIVNCAGRTRSIIGTQSLINAGLPNRVVALRNGTIGWTLAGQSLAHGRQQRFPAVDGARADEARTRARNVAYRAGVRQIDFSILTALAADATRTLYRFDVRTPEEYAAGHLPGFLPAPGGQLVQETDHFAPVRGARIVLADDLGARADMTASWLAQMGWDVLVLTDLSGPRETGDGAPPPPRSPAGRYRRPYEGTDNPAAAMQAYLDWEYGLVDQLARDGTHGFFVI